MSGAQGDATVEQTDVGSYFVANYPPFSTWSVARITDAQVALSERPPAEGGRTRVERPLGLYLHIPFCRKRCHFCYFRVYTDKNAREVEQYLDLMAREWDLYAATPAVAGRKFNFVYFGGGTPSFLSTRQLQGLVARLNATGAWTGADEITFECEPGTLTEAKLAGIREIGVTRLSLGVENFDDRILELNGRAHRSPEIGRAYEYARSLGFPQINLDLIAGMLGETDANWQQCIERTLALAPDSVTIYQMELPYNTTISGDLITQGGQFDDPVAGWSVKRRWAAEAFEALERAGYHMGSAYTAVKNQEKTHFRYRDRLWAGADLIGLGVASFGHIGGTHYQNQHDFEPYLQAVEEGRLPIHRALTPTPEERLIRELVLQLKLGHIHCAYFQDKFGTDIRKRFAVPLRTLEDWGFLTVDGGTVNLNREGLLQVDRLLHEFFLPQHKNARYA